jgi:hypothetical protein
MTTVVYDAAVLIAADRNERGAWAEHKARLEPGVVPVVPTPPVIADDILRLVRASGREVAVVAI